MNRLVLLRRGLWDTHDAQALRQAFEQCRMAARAFRIVLDGDAKRGIGFACQPDGTVALKPESDVETDAPSVFVHMHRLAPDFSVTTKASRCFFEKRSKQKSLLRIDLSKTISNVPTDALCRTPTGRINRDRELFRVWDATPQRHSI
jgi:hypothetical protein